MSASPALRFVLASGDLSAAWHRSRYSHDKYCVSFNNSVVVVHIHIYIYTYIYLSVCLSVCRSVCRSVCLSLSVCLSIIHPSSHPSIHPSIYPLIFRVNYTCSPCLSHLWPQTHLHRGVAARIKDLARPNVQNRAASVEKCCLVRIMKAIRNVMKTRNINQKKWDTQLICKYIYV